MSAEHKMKWTSATGVVFEEMVPDIWIAGFCTNHKCTAEEALAFWRWQTELSEGIFS